jgi:transcriptional regulator with XRE-family HTH domain
MSKLFDEALNNVSSEVKSFVDQPFQIADAIYFALQKQGKNQKDLAEALGKKESEISKWLSGTHNFTLKTISKIEQVLGEKLIYTSIEFNNKVNTATKSIYLLQANQMIKADISHKELWGNINYKSEKGFSTKSGPLTVNESDPYYALPA